MLRETFHLRKNNSEQIYKGVVSLPKKENCHNPDKKQVGPGFIDVAKRNYSDAKILSLLKNPQPQNWPGYATPMPPMPQVPVADAKKIAAWINSLDGEK